jgi:hypothetical protein
MATNYNYFGGIVTNGLVLDLDAAKVASYPGTGTTWYDISGNNNNGTLTNGPTFSGIGKQAAIVFDGVDDYVTEPYASLLNLGTQFTISSFVKLGNTSQTIQPIFAAPNINLGINTQGYSFYWYKDTNFDLLGKSLRLQFGQSEWGWNVYGSNGNVIVDTNHHYVCVTANNLNTSLPTINFYVDGINVGSNYWNASPKGAILYSSNTSSVRVGSIHYPAQPTYDGPYYLNGNIATVQLYNRALSADEVSQNFNALRGRYGI